MRVTESLDSRATWSSGDGVVTLRYELPEYATDVDGDRFYALAADGNCVEARKAFVRGDELVVQFDNASLNSIVEGPADQVEVFGTYTDSRYSEYRSYWNGSVVGRRCDGARPHRAVRGVTRRPPPLISLAPYPPVCAAERPSVCWVLVRR